MYYIILATIIGAIIAFILAISMPVDRDFATLSNKKKAPRKSILASAPVKRVSNLVNRPFAKLPYLRYLQEMLDFMKAPMGALEFLFLKEVAMIFAGYAAWRVLGRLDYTAMMAFAGFIVPDMMLMGKVRDRKDSIVKYFPETVDLLDLCIGAGLDFMSSIRWVLEKSYTNPFMEELRVVLNDIQVGKSRMQSLREMARRLQLQDISSFVRTIIQAERMGVSIEEALRGLSEDTRQMRYEYGERQAIKASLKILIPLLFFILPVILIVVAGPIVIKFTTEGLMPGIGPSGGG